MSQPKLQTALLLAAGVGSKFWPYSSVRNKAAFPIANVPAIRRLADDLIALGIPRIIVVTGYGEASVRAALRGCGTDVVYVRQPEPRGTADAVLHAAHLLEDDFLIVSADVVTARANLDAFCRRWAEEAPIAAALVQPLGQEEPRSWLVAHVEQGLVTGVEGHPRGGRYRLGGVSALSPRALSAVRDNPGIMSRVPVGGMPPVESELAQSLQTLIDEGVSVLAVETVGYHVDLDKPWHVLEANRAVIEAMRHVDLPEADGEGNVIAATARIHDGAEIQGRVVLGENSVIGNRVVARGDLWLADGARVENGAILEGPVVVGRDVVVKDYCQIGGYSSLGSRGYYGHGAEFGGVALATVYCYHYCEIWGVVGQAVDFGAATVCGNLRFDDGDTVWRVQGRSETPTTAANAAYFGDFCRTGVNAIIMPGRRIGVYSCVGPGVIAYDDVPDRQVVTVRQTLETRPWGPERYGW